LAWPNSSLSISESGIAPQLSATNRRLRRAPRSWSARATSSLPVPLSPRIRIDTSWPASRSSAARSLRIAGEVPTSSWSEASSTAGRTRASSRRSLE
jgi:hypothetical protein